MCPWATGTVSDGGGAAGSGDGGGGGEGGGGGPGPASGAGAGPSAGNHMRSLLSIYVLGPVCRHIQ